MRGPIHLDYIRYSAFELTHWRIDADTEQISYSRMHGLAEATDRKDIDHIEWLDYIGVHGRCVMSQQLYLGNLYLYVLCVPLIPGRLLTCFFMDITKRIWGRVWHWDLWHLRVMILEVMSWGLWHWRAMTLRALTLESYDTEGFDTGGYDTGEVDTGGFGTWELCYWILWHWSLWH